MARVALHLLLFVLGRLMAVARRADPVFRGSITRDVVFEIAAGDGVARHWRFDAAGRRVTSHAHHAESPDAAMRFTSPKAALRTLLSKDPSAAEKAVAAGDMRIEGPSALALWFSGLAERATDPRRRGARRRLSLPGAYLEHDSTSRAARFITVEASQDELDPAWEAAWEQRAKLALIRGANGERPSEF